MNDLLYQADKLRGETWEARVENAARIIGLEPVSFQACISSSEAVDTVRRDIERGLELKVRGKPAFVVNEKVYSGRIPAAVLNRAGIPTPLDWE